MEFLAVMVTCNSHSDSDKSYFNTDGSNKWAKNGNSEKSGWAINGDQLCFTGNKKLCRDVQADGKDRII